jgi:hypothetical protein
MVDPLSPPAAVTRIPPIGAGNPDPIDLDAAEQLQRNESDRLALVRARAEKWIGAIAALTTVLAGALIIKGPDDATQMVLGWRVATAATVGVAIALLVFATYRAYRAAFGEPDSLRGLKPDPLTGLHRRLADAQRAAADSALRDLAIAIHAATAAVGLITAAVAITWFAPTAGIPPHRLCIDVNGHLLTRPIADGSSVHEAPQAVTIELCP